MNRDYQLENLPFEIHQSIFSFLSFDDMDRMACVSKYWWKLNENMVLAETATQYNRLIYKMSNERLNLDERVDKLAKDMGTCVGRISWLVFYAIIFIVIVAAFAVWYLITENFTAKMMFTFSPVCVSIPIIIFAKLHRFRIQHKLKVYKVRIDQLLIKQNLLSKKLQDLNEITIKL